MFLFCELSFSKSVMSDGQLAILNLVLYSAL